MTKTKKDSEQCRANERRRRVLFTAAASLVARGTQAIATLISVPLTVRYLGQERYGMWMAISSITGMLAFADFGLGNGLLNAVADAHGRGDRVAARKAVSTAFLLLSTIAVGLMVFFFAIQEGVPWASFFNVQSSVAQMEIRQTVVAVVTCFAIGVPLGVVQRVQLGYQEGFASNLWQAGGAILGLIGLICAVRMGVGVPGLVFAFYGGPLFALVLNFLNQFGRSRTWLVPTPRAFELGIARSLGRAGSMFFVAQLGTVLILNAPNLVIARLLGANTVAPYSVVMKPIQALTLLTALWAIPLWPAYGEAAARGDWNWIARTFRRTAVLGLLVSVSGASLFFAFHRSILGYWVGVDLIPDGLTVGATCLFLVANSVRLTGSMCLNGLGHLRGQVGYQLLVGAAAVGLSLPLARALGLGGIAVAFAVGEAVIGACVAVEVVILLARRADSDADAIRVLEGRA